MQRRVFLIRSARAGAAAGILRQMRANATGETGADGRFAGIRERYFLKTLELNPVTSTYLGGDGYSPALAGVAE